MVTSETAELLPELDEEETAAVILAARKEKLKRQRSRAYWQAIYQPVVMPTVDQLGSWILAESKRKPSEGRPNPRYLGPAGFELDETNRAIFDLLCMYFTADEAFEQAGRLYDEFADSKFSLSKGLALFGPVGCGKTTLLRLFASNPRQSFTLTPCTVVANTYRSAHTSAEADFHYDTYCGRSDVYGCAFKQSRGGRGFDDLGVESIPVKSWGNERNLMAEVLDRRYNLGPEYSGLTHLTTNLSGNQIEELYGLRIRSRMREMFNVIKFDPKTPDRRA